MQEADPLRVAILGPLEVCGAGRGPVEVPGRRLRALLIRLALEPGWVVSAERLIADLWQDDPPSGAANALQALVSRLRAVVGRGTVESGSGGYRLNLPAEAVDVVRFEREVHAARADLAAGRAADAVRRLREALGLWRGSALADVEGEPFADAARAGLEEQRVSAFEDLVEAVLAACAKGSVAALLPELEQLRAAYPLREGLHARYMKVLYALGRHAEALAAYEQLRQTLADLLGVDPSPELAKLHVAMLRQDPDLPSLAAAAGGGAPYGTVGDAGLVGARFANVVASQNSDGLASVASSNPADSADPSTVAASRPRLGNLPAQLTSFIGREAELEHVSELMRAQRLVTLIGPGGAGKTRLAQESGTRLAGQIVDGVWFVPLAAVADGADVAQAVLSALGGEESAWLSAIAIERIEPPAPAERVRAMLAGRAPLLILDNCEHVLDDVAELVDSILAAAPGARVLATSREPLALTGETLCPVSSLALPPDPGTPAAAPEPEPEPEQRAEAIDGVRAVDESLGDGSSAAEQALGYAAIRLLAERARAVRPGFRITAANVEAVTRICRALDGIPLAIELAAARLRALTAQQVADRLDDRFRLLSSGSRTALPRHQTLRAIVDWSWELLGPAERGALARLSVFAGGATPEAAAHVCADVSDEVIDVIATLVDKSLVIAQEDEAGKVRYLLLETMRAYAAERLEESRALTAARDAHARHFLALAELADPHLRGREQMRWTVRLNLERENFSAALRHVVAAEDAESALHFFQALMWYWIMRGRESDAAQWAEEICALLDRIDYRVPDELAEAYQLCTTARRLNAAIQERAEDVDAIANVLLESVPRSSVRARHPLLAMARPIAGVLASRGGESITAREELAELSEHPDPWVRAVRYAFSALLELHGARPDEAEELLERAYHAYDALGDRLGLTFTLVMLTEFSLARGKFEEAARRAQEAYRYASEGLSDDSNAMMLIKVGLSRALAGEVEPGRRLMEQATAAAERLGEYSEAAAGHSELAALALRQGDRAEARRRLMQATELIETRVQHGRAGLAYGAIEARRAYLASLDGEYETARELLRHAADLARSGPMLSFLAGLDEILRGVAALAGLQGDHTRAAELLGSAFAVVGMDNKASYSDAPTRAAALAALGEEAFTAAYERGRSLKKSELLALEP